jgi:hypothetical protein
MFRRKHIDRDAVVAEDSNQAMDYIFAGIKWYLVHKTIKTAIVIMLLLGGCLYTVVDVYQNLIKSKQRIEHNIK